MSTKKKMEKLKTSLLWDNSPEIQRKANEFRENNKDPSHKATTETLIMAIHGPARRGGNRKLRRSQLQGSTELKSEEQIPTSIFNFLL